MVRVSRILLAMVLVGTALPAWAGRIKDSISNVSFVPPPYFQTAFGPKGGPVHYLVTPPDKHTVFTTGALLKRTYRNVRPMNPSELKAVCTEALAALPKGLTLTLSKRYLMDGQNGAECRYQQGANRVIHWVGIPESGQMVYFWADWPQKPSDVQFNLFRQFLGSVQIF